LSSFLLQPRPPPKKKEGGKETAEAAVEHGALKKKKKNKKKKKKTVEPVTAVAIRKKRGKGGSADAPLPSIFHPRCEESEGKRGGSAPIGKGHGSVASYFSLFLTMTERETRKEKKG